MPENSRLHLALDDALERWELIKDKVPEEAERDKFLSRFGDEFIEKPEAKKEARESCYKACSKIRKSILLYQYVIKEFDLFKAISSF
jgi:hypothetical protein